ncbi:WecB/TagA/CpsF family glycosyltransferase [Vampirovibrio sp.]|uniref:WecB/TagA/CpsF family glycosyltransferase n=1 Tax=Vampirovibrio sp. TaxID=2717857 RepID=UPI003594084A
MSANVQTSSESILGVDALSATPYKVSYVLNIPIASLTYQQVLSYLEEQIERKAKNFCVTLNLDILRLTNENESFFNVVKNADFIFADGMPIIWLSQAKGLRSENTIPLPERVPGCDIVQDMCRLSHEKGYKLFILGAGPGVADMASQKLKQQLPNINVVGTYCPSAAELSNDAQSQEIIKTINATAAQVLFVALGAPKQENWVYRHRDQLAPYVILPCGGSIDFIAGTQKKSPTWLGNLGLEWLYRLACNPKRLFKRYILDDLPFLIKAYCKNIRWQPFAAFS